MNRTALYGVHKKLGARMIEFAGWEMPLQYRGIREEHLAVRSSVGVFDISHMGEIEVEGEDALSLCQWVATNDVSRLGDFQAQYTLMCNPNGGVIDDVIIYRISETRFFICVNAINTAKDFKWIKQNAAGKFRVEVKNRSLEFSQLAIQGPSAEEVLIKVLNRDLSLLKRFSFALVSWKGFELMVARTGYTGEDGFEVFLPWERALELWDAVFEEGRPYQIQPCGLGSRDTLRLEMGYPLYGHELDEETNPVEAGLLRFVKLDKGDFVGRTALMDVVSAGPGKRLMGFEMVERGIPRQGYGILKDGDVVGVVTSGTFSPSLQKPIGLGYLRSNSYSENEEIYIDIRGTLRRAKIVSVPFYRKKA
jgi:aminomethyltransferase